MWWIKYLEENSRWTWWEINYTIEESNIAALTITLSLREVPITTTANREHALKLQVKSITTAAPIGQTTNYTTFRCWPNTLLYILSGQARFMTTSRIRLWITFILTHPLQTSYLLLSIFSTSIFGLD